MCSFKLSVTSLDSATSVRTAGIRLDPIDRPDRTVPRPPSGERPSHGALARRRSRSTSIAAAVEQHESQPRSVAPATVPREHSLASTTVDKPPVAPKPPAADRPEGVRSAPAAARRHRSVGRTASLSTDDDSSTQQPEGDQGRLEALAPLTETLVHQGVQDTSLVDDETWTSLLQTCVSIEDVLDKQGMLERGRNRKALLQTLFRVIEVHRDAINSASPPASLAALALRLAKIAFLLRQEGSTFTATAKLIFRLSRVAAHDPLFDAHGLERVLVRLLSVATTSPSQLQGLIYVMATLRNLSNDDTAQSRFARDLHLIEALTVLLSHVVHASCTTAITPAPSTPNTPLSHTSNSISSSSSTTSDLLRQQYTHLVVLVTATLRNLAVAPDHRPLFRRAQVTQALYRLLQPFCSDSEVILNVSRILSKLTITTDMHMKIPSTTITTPVDASNKIADSTPEINGALEQLSVALVPLLARYATTHQPIVLRIAFVLGNLTSHANGVRLALFNAFSAITIFFALLDEYAKQIKKRESTPDLADAQNIVIKLIRVIANLSIHPEVGPSIAALKSVESVIQFIDGQCGNEELVLNAVGAVHNLSYYDDPRNCVICLRLSVVERLIPLLQHENVEMITEASRVLGNLTRYEDVRTLLRSQGVGPLLLSVVQEHKRSSEVVITACGVLINMMADREHRRFLCEASGPNILVDVLVQWGREDWTVCQLVCKTLFNYSAGMSSAIDEFGQQCCVELMGLLADFIDDVHAELPNDRVLRHSDDFLAVAQRLLDAIKAHYPQRLLSPGPLRAGDPRQTAENDSAT